MLLKKIGLQWCRNRGGQGGHWPPQYLADQLTLFEPGRADYPHLLLLAPSMFVAFRHHWCMYILQNIWIFYLQLFLLVWFFLTKYISTLNIAMHELFSQCFTSSTTTSLAKYSWRYEIKPKVQFFKNTFDYWQFWFYFLLLI